MNFKTSIACALALAACAAAAQIKVGVTIPQTGPAAMLGLGQKKAMEMYPNKMGSLSVDYQVLDDASDTTGAVTNAKKLIIEQKVDVIIGSSTTPQCLAMLDTVAESETPLICLGSSSAVVAPMDAKRKWVFKIPPNDAVWIEGMVAHMAANGVKQVGFIGFSDAFGEGWAAALGELAPKHKLNVVASERYSRTDSSVLAQVIKVLAKQPDAVLIAASGTPAALPAATLRERGFKGKIYLNASVATKEFFQTAGAAAEGALLTVGVGMVIDQVPDSNPLKRMNVEFRNQYEAKFGPGTLNIFALQGYDAYRLLDKAVPIAAAKAKPGTREFRVALRDALEGIKEMNGNTGIYSFSPSDHSGLDLRAVVVTRVEKGQLVYVPQ